MLAPLNFSQKRSEVYPVKSESHLTGADLTGELFAITYACPVKFFEENKRSVFNWGASSYELSPLSYEPLLSINH